MVMKKTVLITGGFGLLGGRLGQYLSGEYNVILASRTDQVAPDWLPLSKTIKIDWESERSLLNACKSVDIIIHASGLNAQECGDDPEKALLVNGTYTQRLVNVAVKQDVKKIIYLSTAHVYSKNLTGVVTEDMPATNEHPYAKSHITGEVAVLSATNQGDTGGVVVRIANAFGRPANKDVNCWMLLVNDLCRQAVVKKSLTLYSNSKIVRDFVTISDFCSVIGFLIEDNNTSPSHIINIGSGKSCTIGEMATKIQSNCLNVLGFEPPIIFKQKSSINKSSFDFQTNYLDSIGFKFVNDFDEEIKKMIYFCKESFRVE
jgi:UDP-glucose 4-epimerase